MFLRRNRRKKNGEIYEYWSLVKSVRTPNGPRQRTVATLGKLPGMDTETQMGWEHISDVLDGKLKQLDLLKEDQELEPPKWAQVDINSIRVERMRRFGDVYLALALWRRLGLDQFFDQAMSRGREKIPWSTMACILTLARFCAPSSELQIAEFWYGKTALDELLGVPAGKINDDRLYRTLDQLLPHKDQLFQHLQKTYGEMFGIKYNLLLYDITSTYFEGAMKGNSQAKRGYSRDKRSDCVQVCIGLVVTPCGLPLSYEVFDGNRTDVTTVDEIVEKMREKYGQEERVWVMDRGMVSEDNLDMLRKSNASYLVGTPKSMLKQFEKELLEQDWETVETGVEIKLCQGPDDLKETFVLCRSPGRIQKEQAMRQRQIDGMQDGLDKLQKRMGKVPRGLRDRDKVNQRLGRLFQKYPAAARLYNITITEQADPEHKSGVCLSMEIQTKRDLQQWVEQVDGCYLLRTNLQGYGAEFLWKTYIGLTQIEDSFRICKHDLGIRPIFHHGTERTQAHILVCFLSLVMWRTLQQWMEASGLGSAPRKLLEEMAEIRSLDVVFPVKDGHEIRLRTVGKPEDHLAILLQHLDLPLPSKPKEISNVVATFEKKTQVS